MTPLRSRTILLIAPEIINLRSMPCVGLGYIGAYLRERGRSVRIVDAQFTKEDAVQALIATPPTVVAIGVDSRTLPRGLRLARIAKRLGHTTVFGGLHVSLVKSEILDYTDVDYGIVGDGEVPLDTLCDALDGLCSFETVPGLVYRDVSGGVRFNPNTAEVADLDLLPFPDYSLAGITHFPLYPLVTSRDCPYKCTYCTVGNISHGRFRSRTAASCVDELLYAKEKYGIRGFLVVDENFSFRIERALEFCEELIARGVDLPWSAFEGMRADCLAKNPEILDLLKRSGCRWVFFGIESAENAILKNVRKGQKFEVVERATYLARRSGVKVGGFFIVGLPSATFERDLLTVHWAVEHLDGATFWMSIPYRNTGLYHWVRSNGRLLREPIGDNIVNSLSTTPFYDTEEYPAKLVKQAHTIASLRTGVDYYFEHIDREASARLGQAFTGNTARRQRLLRDVARFDPSMLAQWSSDERRLCGRDPIEEVVSRAKSAASLSDPLPVDLLRAVGSLSSLRSAERSDT